MKQLNSFRVVVAVSMLLAACGADVTTTSQPVSTTSSTVIGTTVADTTTTGPESPTGDRSDPAEGWGRLDVDTEVFGGLVPVGGAAQDGRTVLVACSDDGSFPVWWSDADLEFERANGPEGVSCVQQVESTALGWFGGGAGQLLRSADGITWEEVDVAGSLGYEEPFQLGYADNLFVSPDGTRITVLYRRAAEAESTVATLVTTVDGETWVQNAHPSQSLFDSSSIAAVIEGGDGLLAGGSSPGGEFVPTAAVFTSRDGLSWRRLTPRGNPDFDDKVINDVARIGDRFIAVGGDFFQTGLMTAWTSADGLQWQRLPHPAETTDPSVAQMFGQVIGVADGSIWISGQDFDARRGEPQALPALWRSPDGVAWERVSVDELDVYVPFEIVSTPDFRIGVWPAPSSLIDEPIILFGAD